MTRVPTFTPTPVRSGGGGKRSDVRVVVPTERHVERLGLEGVVAETRSALLRRLVEAFSGQVRWAAPEVTRLALTESLRAALWDDPLLGALVRAGGGPYLRTVELVDAAIGELRRAATPLSLLERTDKSSSGPRPLMGGGVGGGAGLRAATLRLAIVALDRTLEARGLIDARSQGRVLADVLARAAPEEVMAVVGARELVARYIVAWDGADVAWWRALSIRMARASGRVVVELPTFEKLALDATRERDPLDIVFDDLVARLDEAPVAASIAPVLGDFMGGAPPADASRIAVVAAADAARQARAVTHAVAAALAEGVPVDRIAVAIPRIDEDVLTPLRTAFQEAGIPHHEPRGAPPTASAIVATALESHGLAGRGLPRLEVAMLLRSRYVDATKITGNPDRAQAKRALLAIADALEGAPTAAASDAAHGLEETVVSSVASGESLRPLARRIAETLSAIELAKTRSAHVRAARALWEALGFPARVSLDARSTLARDDVARGLARAELAALAHDAHGWRVLMDSLEAYAGAITLLGLGGSAINSETFRHELGRTLEAGAPPPGAGRIGAVRVVRLGEIAGEPLARLFVLEANEGVLPSSEGAGPLLTENLTNRLRTLDASASPPASGVLRARELAGLALSASRAERVTFFYRDTGRDGEALAPAPLATWLVRAGAEAKRAGGGLLVDAPLSEREARLQALARGDDEARSLDPEAARRAGVERARETFHGLASPRPRSAVVGDHVADVAAQALIVEELGPDRALPITALERFARCAFQGYVHQVLGARDSRVAAETPDAREAGTIVHEALAAGMRAAASQLAARPVDADAVRTLAMEAADQVLRRGNESPLRKLALELARERVLRVVDWTLLQDDWIFALAEQAFGDVEHDARGPVPSWPALVIGEGASAVRLRGTIDRVDVGRRGRAGAGASSVRVIDYKSSANTVRDAKRELGKTMLQVPLYALAARDALGASRAEGLYLPVAELEPRFGEDASLAKKWQELSADDSAPLRGRVLELLDRVRAGELAPTPEHESFCDTCSFDGICRRPRFIAGDEEGGESGEGGEGRGA